MKKYLLMFLLSFLFVRCVPTNLNVTKEQDKIVRNYALDFSSYSKRGFMITPDEIGLQSYESIGLVTTIIYPKVKQDRKKMMEHSEEVVYIIGGWLTEPINTKEAIDTLVSMSIKMGADAIAKFKVAETYYMNGNLRVPGIEVSGFAIKRKALDIKIRN